MLCAVSFSIGFIFYYWKAYSSDVAALGIKQKTDNINDLSGYTPQELYVPKKYSSLKEELLHNDICRLSTAQFDDVLVKSREYISCGKTRSIQSVGGSFLQTLKYGVKPNQALPLTHLLSVVLYCDWTELCTAFSGTFRRKKSSESRASVKKRNAEFWSWSRLLRETVECYGQNGRGYANSHPLPITGPFYCGMSFMMTLPQFNMRLCGMLRVVLLSVR